MQVMTPENIDRLVGEANAYIEKLACEPKADLVPLQRQTDSTRRKREKLIDVIGESSDFNLDAIRRQISAYSQKIRTIQDELDSPKAQNEQRPNPRWLRTSREEPNP